MEEQEIRLNKYLSDAGVCSRREADRLLEQGRIAVDGQKACVGQKITSSQRVAVDGNLVVPNRKMVLLAVNKPKGIVCTAEKREKNNIVNFINYPLRIYPVGRLDKDSQGLLLMTNCGDIVNKMMRAGNRHEKEYLVTVDKPVTPAFIEKMAAGVPILDTVTRECRVEATGKNSFRIILTQGLNRQIRRMCEYFSYRVVKLVRIRVMNIELGNLPEGHYREVTPQEMEELQRLTAHSSNQTIIEPGERHEKRRHSKKSHR